MRSNRIYIVFFILSAILLVGLLLVDLYIGNAKISWMELWDIILLRSTANEMNSTIVWDIRIPRLWTACIVGATLSVAGLQMQTIFRNPLAGPYILGVSSGASLGVAILVLGVGSSWYHFVGSGIGSWSIAAAAWIGAGIVLAFVLYVSSRVRGVMTVLVLGILFSGVATSIVNLLQYFGSKAALKSFVVWTMGSIGAATSSQLIVMSMVSLLGVAISFVMSKRLDAFMLGERYALSLGVHLKWTRALIFLSTTMIAGTVTAFCGPIGFIGVAIPHISRMILSSASHKFLIPASMILGAIFLVLGDIISQVPGYSLVLPINSVMSLLGIPIVVWVILNKRVIN
ncbi:iron ABC transporter permease [Halosquirtibacter xylanolyticus]|uniref:FecCD family ABC transporter permease n=1 Tax=Halosquirtibacter xylanolyticus TaxID=3374599 RepID=UPI00374811D8|nr:iron ABC transporter permease [Prolixibacteraceae bacterium]